MKPTPARSPAENPARIAVALVEDDAHYLLFLESALGASTRHRVAATAGSAAAVAQWPAAVAPHVALVDIGLPDRPGPALVAELLARFPSLLVIMLTARTNEEDILATIRAGAVGYLLKGVKEPEILAAIDDALAGGAPMSPTIARRVLTAMRETPALPKTAAAAPGGAELALLTPREREVLELVAAGASNKEVCERLGLALSTTKNCLLAIYTKWRVRSRTEAALKFQHAR